MNPIIRSVYLNDRAFQRIEDLIVKSLQLAQLVNQIASTKYEHFGFDYSKIDRQYGHDVIPDPFRNALKLQKFHGLAAGGMLYSAAHAAKRNLDPTYYYSTELTVGILCRSGLENACVSSHVLSQKEPKDKMSAMLAVFQKGIRDYKWDRPNNIRNSDFYKAMMNWGNESNLPRTQKFNVSETAKKLSSISDDPYSLLSDPAHGNSALVSISVIDCQEDLGYSLQYDFLWLSILYESIINLCDQFLRAIVIYQPNQKELERTLSIHKRYLGIVISGFAEPWGELKHVPDRDYE